MNYEIRAAEVILVKGEPQDICRDKGFVPGKPFEWDINQFPHRGLSPVSADDVACLKNARGVRFHVFDNDVDSSLVLVQGDKSGVEEEFERGICLTMFSDRVRVDRSRLGRGISCVLR